jgi:RNA polymerase sigma factor (sigma-70 family)
MNEPKFSEDPVISDLIRDVAAGEVSRNRAMGWWRSDWYFDWWDLAQELCRDVPRLIAAFNPQRGVPLSAYLKQRLTWNARKIIRPERGWQSQRVKFEEYETVEASQGHGTRTRGNKKITLRDFGAGALLVERSMDLLQDALWALPVDERGMLRMYFNGATQAQIACAVSEFGSQISQSQVSRRIQAAIKKLSDAMHKTSGRKTNT